MEIVKGLARFVDVNPVARIADVFQLGWGVLKIDFPRDAGPCSPLLHDFKGYQGMIPYLDGGD